MRIAVCDDELYFLNQIKDALLTVEKEENIFCFSDGKRLLDEAEKNLYNIVYLDIEMPGINGIAVAEELKRRNKSLIIIFVSSYTCYVSKAFHVDAFQFLIKEHADKEAVLLEYHRAKARYLKDHYRYTIKQNTESKEFEICNIVYLESKNRHLYLNTNAGEEYEYRGKLDKESEKLTAYHFVRVHESYLINMAYISVYGNDELILNCGKEKKSIPVSRRYREELAFAYNLYLVGCSI